MPHPSSLPQRDPVAAAIEDFLQLEHAAGRGPLKIRLHTDGLASVRFGPVTAHGHTCDIAFVRLAQLLLNDPRCRQPLMERLRGG